jgi:hypothetical protein
LYKIGWPLRPCKPWSLLFIHLHQRFAYTRELVLFEWRIVRPSSFFLCLICQKHCA